MTTNVSYRNADIQVVGKMSALQKRLQQMPSENDPTLTAVKELFECVAQLHKAVQSIANEIP